MLRPYQKQCQELRIASLNSTKNGLGGTMLTQNYLRTCRFTIPEKSDEPKYGRVDTEESRIYKIEIFKNRIRSEPNTPFNCVAMISDPTLPFNILLIWKLILIVNFLTFQFKLFVGNLPSIIEEKNISLRIFIG